MNLAHDKLTSLITLMAVIMAAAVAVGLPLTYFTLSYSYQEAALKTEAEINARIVSEHINENPEMWRFEELRLTELLRRRPSTGTAEVRRVLDLDRSVIAQSAEPLDRPIQTRAGSLMDAGRSVGTIEISRSLRPLLLRTGLLAFAGILLGIAAFRTLRTAPLRALHQALVSLSEEKERAQVTLRSIGDGVITTDARGRVMMLNGVAEDLTGWQNEDALGKPLNEIFHIVHEKTRATCENPVERVLREMRTIELANHTVLIAKDGTERAIADSGAPIRSEDGSIVGVVLVFRDVTEKQKHEAEMQKAAKLDSLGVLAGGIAHDFNNILTAIMGNISLAMLDRQAGHNGQDEDCLLRADSACKRAQNLTRQLLTFSRGGTPVKETVSLLELIRSSAEFALTGSGIRSQIHSGADVPPVDADAGQINQVLHNLLINAVEAMPNGGMVAISVDRILANKDGNRLPLAPGEYVLISMRDEGIGIPKDHITRIFDPYFTTKKKGSGLGLATCYSIIKNHDGHIAVESELGKGSVFRIYLPASSSRLLKKQDAQDNIIRGKGTVLVMDDEEIIRTTAHRMLALLGYETLLAADGAEAVALYQRSLSAGKRIDAVILDLTIPGGMGGKEAMEKLLALDPGIRAIVSSGYSENPVISDFKRYGFSGAIGKPYDVKQMSRALNAVIRNTNPSA